MKTQNNKAIKTTAHFSKFILAFLFFIVSPLTTNTSLWSQENNSNPCVSGTSELANAALGSFEERQSKFRAIITKCPGMAEAHYNFGVLLLENKQANAAIAQFEAAIKLRDVIEYRLALASALVSDGEFLTAKTIYENIIAADPRSIRALLGISAVLDKLGKPTDALDYLNKAYGIEPDNVFVNYNIGVLYDRLGQSDAAVVSFERTLRSDPKHFQAQLLLGLALKKAGRSDEALSALKKASEDSNSTVDGHRAYAWELEELGMLDDAEVVLRRALGNHLGDEKLLEQLSVVLLRKHQESNAKPLIEQLILKKPDEARFLALYGWTLLRLGDQAAAEKALKDAVQKDPAGAFGFYALGQLYSQTGQSDLSKTNLETAYTLEPSFKESSSEEWWKFW